MALALRDRKVMGDLASAEEAWTLSAKKQALFVPSNRLI